MKMNVNNSLLISTCILSDLPGHKNPIVLCWGSSHNFICSHVPMEIFNFYKMGKKQRNKKRVVYIKGRKFQYSCIPLGKS
jgi:hypothetical protein